MATTRQVVEYIDERIDDALQRPRMHAPTPEALELALWVMDDIRTVALTGSSQSALGISWYAAFMEERGFGAHNFVSCRKLDSPTPIDDDELFRDLSELWREYIAYRNAALGARAAAAKPNSVAAGKEGGPLPETEGEP